MVVVGDGLVRGGYPPEATCGVVQFDSPVEDAELMQGIRRGRVIATKFRRLHPEQAVPVDPTYAMPWAGRHLAIPAYSIRDRFIRMRGKAKDKPPTGTGTVPPISVAVDENLEAGVGNSWQVVEVLPAPWPPFGSTLELAAGSIVKGNLAMARLVSGDCVAVRKVADASLTDAAGRARDLFAPPLAPPPAPARPAQGPANQRLQVAWQFLRAL